MKLFSENTHSAICTAKQIKLFLRTLSSVKIISQNLVGVLKSHLRISTQTSLFWNIINIKVTSSLKKKEKNVYMAY